MKNTTDFLRSIERIVERDDRYKVEAYGFVMAALNYTVSKLPEPRHVTGKELLEGIREFGLQQFGPMTRTVFEHWGVKSCENFGEIVFNLVDGHLLGKTKDDSKDDFKGGYDFKEAFDNVYQLDEEKESNP